MSTDWIRRPFAPEPSPGRPLARALTSNSLTPPLDGQAGALATLPATMAGTSNLTDLTIRPPVTPAELVEVEWTADKVCLLPDQTLSVKGQRYVMSSWYAKYFVGRGLARYTSGPRSLTREEREARDRKLKIAVAQEIAHRNANPEPVAPAPAPEIAPARRVRCKVLKPHLGPDGQPVAVGDIVVMDIDAAVRQSTLRRPQVSILPDVEQGVA